MSSGDLAFILIVVCICIAIILVLRYFRAKWEAKIKTEKENRKMAMVRCPGCGQLYNNTNQAEVIAHLNC